VRTMDIRALVLVNSAWDAVEPVVLSPLPPALLEVVGKSPLQRTIERLKESGFEQVLAVVESDDLPQPTTPGNHQCIVPAGPDRFWRIAETAFNEMAQGGAELVLLIRMGAYTEIDFEKLVQFHLDQQSRVTQVAHQGQPIEVFCISASRRNDAASLFRSQLSRCRSECPLFENKGYFNALTGPRDLRQLAIDILTLKAESRPVGNQVRPGVWVADDAIIEKGARVVAPAFVGSSARVRSHAVVTRCSAVEHHAQVDCGTVVENSTVLPYAYVGAGLDLAHSVVGLGSLANLRRDALIEIADRKLISYASETAGWRFLSSAVAFTTFLPKQIWHGMFGKPQPQQRDLQTALRQTSPALGSAAGYKASACDTEAAGEFPSNLAIVRRYGHQ